MSEEHKNTSREGLIDMLEESEDLRREAAAELAALRAHVEELKSALAEVLSNPSRVSLSASAWSIRNNGFPVTDELADRADYYESILSVLEK